MPVQSPELFALAADALPPYLYDLEPGELAGLARHPSPLAGHGMVAWTLPCFSLCSLAFKFFMVLQVATTCINKNEKVIDKQTLSQLFRMS